MRAAGSAEAATRNGEPSDQLGSIHGLRLAKSSEGAMEPLGEGSLRGENCAAAPSRQDTLLGSKVVHRPLESCGTKGWPKVRPAIEGGGWGPAGPGPGLFTRLYELAWVLIVMAGTGFLYLLGTSVHAPSIAPNLPSLNPIQFPGTVSYPHPGKSGTPMLTPIESLGRPSVSGGLAVGGAKQGSGQDIRGVGTATEAGGSAGVGTRPAGGGAGPEVGAGVGTGVHSLHGAGPEHTAESDQEVGPRMFQDDYVLARRRRSLSARCDLWTGRWVYDPSYPLWPVGSCQVGMNGSGCTELGRKDTDFMRFRWQPDGCTIPRCALCAPTTRLHPREQTSM